MSYLRSEFEALYRQNAPSVFRRARQMLRDEDEAREVTQDLFLSLVERPAQYRGQSTMTTFLYSATTHACLNRLRNRRTRARLLNERVQPLESEVDRALGADQRFAITQRLLELPPPLGEVAIYHFMDELTQDEIARILQCSRRHVGNLIERLAHEIQTMEQA